MRVTGNHASAEVSGIQAANFGFEMNAKMYSIMLDKMYKNKVGSLLRELCSNAWDSHVDLGNTDVPFDISMPTWLDKSFSIRDYGTGIPHDLFENIYTNVGKSTREDNEEAIGGYGLGSKVPFALTDSFIVENWNDGRKTTWACFKSSGFPQVSMVGDEASDEPTGLKVSFTFSSDVVSSFPEELRKQLMFFPVKPNVTGETLDWYELPDLSSGYAYNDTYPSHVVVMGNVGYPLDPSDLGITHYGADSDLRTLFNSTLVLDVPLGSVDIPPSRESLEFTEKTVKYLKGRLQGIARQYATDFVIELKKQKDLFSAKVWVHEQNQLLLTDLRKSTQLVKLKNKLSYPLNDLFNGYYNFMEGHTVKRFEKYYKNFLRGHTNESLKASVIAKSILVVNDLPKNSVSYILDNKQGFLTTLSQARIRTDLFLIDGQSTYNKDTRVSDAEATIKQIEKEYGLTAVTLSSLIGFPDIVVKSKSSGTSKPVDWYLYEPKNKAHGSTLASKVVKGTTDLPSKGYYLMIKRWDLHDTSITLDELPLYSEFLEEEIYLIRQTSNVEIPNGLKKLETTTEDIANKMKKYLRLCSRRRAYHAVQNKTAPRLPQYVKIGRTKDEKLNRFVTLALAVSSTSGKTTDKRERVYTSFVIKVDSTYKIEDYVIPDKVTDLLTHYGNNYAQLVYNASLGYSDDQDLILTQIKNLINL